MKLYIAVYSRWHIEKDAPDYEIHAIKAPNEDEANRIASQMQPRLWGLTLLNEVTEPMSNNSEWIASFP